MNWSLVYRVCLKLTENIQVWLGRGPATSVEQWAVTVTDGRWHLVSLVIGSLSHLVIIGSLSHLVIIGTLSRLVIGSL